MDQNIRRIESVTDRMTDAQVRQLMRAYRDSLNEVQGQLSAAFVKYADPLGEATYTELVKYNRLARLEENIAAELKRLGAGGVRTTQTSLANIYEEAYYRGSFAIDQAVRTDYNMWTSFDKIPREQVIQSVMNPVEGIQTWDKRLLGHIGQLETRTNDAIVRGLIQGKSYTNIAREVKDYFERGAWQAERLVRTEAHMAREAGKQLSYAEAEKDGVEMQKMWMSSMDDRVRDEHGWADGQTVNVNDKFMVGGEELEYPGDRRGSAGNVINCRCNSAPVVEGMKPVQRRERLTDEEYSFRKDQEAAAARAAGRDPNPIPRGEVKPWRSYPEYAEAKGILLKYKGPEPRV